MKTLSTATRRARLAQRRPKASAQGPNAHRGGPWLMTLLAGAVFGLLPACSSDETGRAPNSARPDEPATAFSQRTAALTGDCRLNTVGLPCDPDGDDGTATECEGLCWVDDDATISCRPVEELGRAVTDLNGRICGDAEGLDCGHSCENGACVAKNARLGSACRPTSRSSTCDGVCTLIGGEPTCDEVPTCNDPGISEDGCTLRACDFDTNTGSDCVTFELDNATCEASKAGADDDSATDDAGARDAAVAAEAGAPDDGKNEDVVDAAATSDEGRDASTNTPPPRDVDGGASPDAGPPRPGNKRTAAKVVGGACSLNASRSSAPAGVWGLMLGLGLLLRGRRTSARRL